MEATLLVATANCRKLSYFGKSALPAHSKE
jgi:hypothetical protein